MPIVGVLYPKSEIGNDSVMNDERRFPALLCCEIVYLIPQCLLLRRHLPQKDLKFPQIRRPETQGSLVCL
jgi:hypothetical protein